MKTKTTYVYLFQDPPTEKYPREPFEVEFNSHKAAEDYIATDGFAARFKFVRVKILK